MFLKGRALERNDLVNWRVLKRQAFEIALQDQERLKEAICGGEEVNALKWVWKTMVSPKDHQAPKNKPNVGYGSAEQAKTAQCSFDP